MTSLPIRLLGDAPGASLTGFRHPPNALRADSGMRTGRPFSPIQTVVTRALTAGLPSGASVTRRIS